MKEVQEDNFPSHKLTKHNNDPTCKALIPLDNKQQKLLQLQILINILIYQLTFRKTLTSKERLGLKCWP